jgi:hypothetical protein
MVEAAAGEIGILQLKWVRRGLGVMRVGYRQELCSGQDITKESAAQKSDSCLDLRAEEDAWNLEKREWGSPLL